MSGPDSWAAKISPQVRQLADRADSLFAGKILKDLATLERECADVCKSQDAVLEHLKKPPGIERTRAVIIAWSGLIRDLGRLHTGVGATSVRLGTYFKAAPHQEPFYSLSQFTGEVGRLADLHQDTFEMFVINNLK